MATSISFTDDTGFVSITNGFPVPGDRFRGWKPLVSPIGPLHHALGTGTPTSLGRTGRTTGPSSTCPTSRTARRTIASGSSDWKRGGHHHRHLTGDQFTSTYDCYLWPGSKPSLGPANAQDLRHVLSLAVLNTSRASA
jgi:hypothetical protein